MSRQTITIGNPHVLRERVLVSLPLFDVMVPTAEYDNPMDAIISAMLLNLAGMSAMLRDVQTVIASFHPRIENNGSAMLVDNADACVAALNRIHDSVAAQTAALAAMQASAETPTIAPGKA